MSSTVSSAGTTALTVLQKISQQTAQLTQQEQLQNISQDLQNQLNRQLAAIQPPVDQVSIDMSNTRINGLQAQQKTISGLETTFGNNGTNLSDMSSQLNLMAKAITNSDGTAFDNALSALTTDLSDTTPPAWNAIFQPDGLAQLKNAGITIQSSASYDLSSAGGQAAATADVTALQNTIQSIIKVNGANQTVAASQLTALNGQIGALQSVQLQQQLDSAQVLATQQQTLTTNMQNQLHLIQLAMGNASSLATALTAAMNPPQPTTSVFGALVNSIGETASTAESQLGNNPAILSLFA
ncbi:MAG TPA: hypothetical protein VHY80_21750 [Stellaceae bacterium]|jgi:hypothetical protein|nr:hypothetical protein [Stellaceae bacterium]